MYEKELWQRGSVKRIQSVHCSRNYLSYPQPFFPQQFKNNTSYYFHSHTPLNYIPQLRSSTNKLRKRKFARVHQLALKCPESFDRERASQSVTMSDLQGSFGNKHIRKRKAHNMWQILVRVRSK